MQNCFRRIENYWLQSPLNIFWFRRISRLSFRCMRPEQYSTPLDRFLVGRKYINMNSEIVLIALMILTIFFFFLIWLLIFTFSASQMISRANETQKTETDEILSADSGKRALLENKMNLYFLRAKMCECSMGKFEWIIRCEFCVAFCPKSHNSFAS